ncbi:MAG: prenyltransferase [Pseudonocardiaceae bacterium]
MAAALVSEMSADSDGQFSASVYETGRLVALAPSLRGHRERVHFLLDHQHANGEWGGPDHYAIVPTLSATEALLRDIELGSGQRLPYPAMVSAAERGLRALFARLDGRAPILPDTVAIELIVPALIIDINEHLAGKAGLDSVADGRLLPAPDGANAALLARLRESVHQGRALPRTLLHSLEVIGTPVRGAPSVEPNRGGVGCSPAATAAWLGDVAAGGNHHPFVRYLESVQDVDGAVPVAAPLGLFERAWVLSTLAEAGLGSTAERSLVQSIHTEFGEWGVAGGPGLPPDADDTATALYALARYGRPRSPACLWAYRAGAHFSCFPGERTPSTSTNAHVLQAFGACLTPDLPERSDYLQAMARLTGWLADHQDDDGSWRDKWHASPYYATKCCVVALVEHGGAAGAAAASRAVRWVLDLQRPDGSWGHWVGTPEETAYALQILVRANDSGTGDVIARAAARGCAFLLRAGGHHEHPPLWHDKDLYTPMRIVRAEVLAGLHLAHTDRRVRALLSRGAAT